MEQELQHRRPTQSQEADAGGSGRSEAPPAPVTVVGLGKMGKALTSALLKQGHPVTVWNRSAGRADEMVRQGATAATGIDAAISASPLIIVCVTDYAGAHGILAPFGPLLAGRTLVNLSNGTPEQARRMAEWAAALGADYVDGGIMAIPPMISRPEALILYSGSERAFERHRRAFDAFGTSMYLGGDPGLAPLFDLALLSAMYGMFGGYFHALAMVGADNVPAVDFTRLVIPWLHAMIAGFPRMAESVDSGDHATDISSLDINDVGFDNLIEASRGQGVRLDLVAPLQALVRRGVAEGYSSDGLSRLAVLLRQPAEPEADAEKPA
ncbi:NAD(P)-dependent oxidoreductase [Cohnella sp. REN36]|uniref:NAD(P)-dependent oxidoreductase n=1 Tax=Cohnella sp. REN36 TaxID=2887347 RepID=UPI001D14DED8|nr:NAD(P)-binding domain-containing protein [Cohnella sp. REN36]MCC3377382.1 NAD(P)-binding domain-containing protein [Cohnella sp. REN36]